MKRFLYITIAFAAVAISCTKSNIVDVPEGQKTPITFDTYNGKIPVTKASELTTTTISGIHVSGFRVLEGQTSPTSFADDYMSADVTKAEGAWTYDPLAYWPASGTLHFVAYGSNTKATEGATTGTGVLLPIPDAPYTQFTYYVPTAAADQQDLVVSGAVAGTPGSVVMFEMKHLLSKVGFKLMTIGSGTNVKINNITLHGTFVNNGTVNLEASTSDVKITPKANPSVDDKTTSYSLFTSDQHFQTSSAGTSDIYDMSDIPTVDPELEGEEKEAAEAAVTAATTTARNNRYMMIMPGVVGNNETSVNEKIGVKPYIEVNYDLGNATGKRALIQLPDKDENTNWTFEAGYAYEFIFEIAISEIKFTGVVQPWDETGTNPGTELN